LVVELARGVRLRHDRVRDRWMLLAPERGYVLNARGRAVVEAIAAGRDLEPDTAAFVDDLVARKLVVRR